MRVLRVVLGLVIVAVVAVAAFLLWSRRPEIAAVDPAQRPKFAGALLQKGAELASLGDCAVCHTVPGGPAYAGGRAIPTPFGTIYSANVTSDPETGIGRWSEAAFVRAMRQGVSRTGRYLYPAFPYDHFARVSGSDLEALYAFMVTRPAVRYRAPANALPFPLNLRLIVAFWDALYLERGAYRADASRSALWNRGAYLVTGLGHCGDCHTPRNFLGAEKSGHALTGGRAEGWQAPALGAGSPAPIPWDAVHLETYLRQGADPEHGAAAGPMQPVTQALARADTKDVAAIAAYIASLVPPPSPAREQRSAALLARADRLAAGTLVSAPGDSLGATIFAGACARCHGGGPSLVPPRGVDLALSSAIAAPDPLDAIRIILGGIAPPEGTSGPWMPRFEGSFSDAQMAALLSYLRAHDGAGPAWTDLATRIHDVRRQDVRQR